MMNQQEIFDLALANQEKAKRVLDKFGLLFQILNLYLIDTAIFGA